MITTTSTTPLLIKQAAPKIWTLPVLIITHHATNTRMSIATSIG